MSEVQQSSGTCLDEEGIVELLQGTLAPAARETVASHLGSCSACRKVVAEMTLALSGPAQAGADELAPLRAGATLGRYVVIGPVGGGAMGLVYAAFDRELGRKVALKLLRPAALGILLGRFCSAPACGAKPRRWRCSRIPTSSQCTRSTRSRGASSSPWSSSRGTR